MKDSLQKELRKRLSEMINTEMAKHILGLLLGREKPAFDGDLLGMVYRVDG